MVLQNCINGIAIHLDNTKEAQHKKPCNFSLQGFYSLLLFKTMRFLILILLLL